MREVGRRTEGLTHDQTCVSALSSPSRPVTDNGLLKAERGLHEPGNGFRRGEIVFHCLPHPLIYVPPQKDAFFSNLRRNDGDGHSLSTGS
jgi:hypothetical protein